MKIQGIFLSFHLCYRHISFYLNGGNDVHGKKYLMYCIFFINYRIQPHSCLAVFSFLSKFTLPYPTLPYPTLPCPTLPYPTLPYPTLPYPTLPYPTLPYPTLPYPTLPYPTLPYPTLPYYMFKKLLRT